MSLLCSDSALWVEPVESNDRKEPLQVLLVSENIIHNVVRRNGVGKETAAGPQGRHQ